MGWFFFGRWLVNGGDFLSQLLAIDAKQGVENFGVAHSYAVASDGNGGFDFFASAQVFPMVAEFDDEACVFFGLSFPDERIIFAVRMSLSAAAVSFLFEVPGVGSAIDFGADRAFVLHHGGKSIVRADKA